MHRKPGMNHLAVAVLIAFSFAFGAGRTAEGKKPPRRLVFPSKAGDVNFDHLAHLKREQGTCIACHNGLWQKSATVPVKSSSGCATCHGVGGKSFELKDHCAKCHAHKAAASDLNAGDHRLHRPRCDIHTERLIYPE